MHAVGRIRDALAAARPSGRGRFASGAAAMTRRLRALDAAIARCMAEVPAAERKLVTDHDALGAFADRYGIEVVGARDPGAARPRPSPRPATSAGCRRSSGASASGPCSPSRRSTRAWSGRSRARPARRADYELYGDTLGPAGSDGATYVGSEAHNADAMVRGFTAGRRGCSIALR